MKTINDQPQELLVRYAGRTGCKWKWKDMQKGSWKSGEGWDLERIVYHEHDIRLVLTHGLPSHLKPYKENPRDPGEGYRVPAFGESTDQPHQCFNILNKWDSAGMVIGRFENFHRNDYRLPASVMPPDWEEMTREEVNCVDPVLVPKFIHEALDTAGAPTHHEANLGCQLPKPMMPCERIAWLGDKLDGYKAAYDEWSKYMAWASNDEEIKGHIGWHIGEAAGAVFKCLKDKVANLKQQNSSLSIWKEDMTTEYGKLEKWYQDAQKEIKRLEQPQQPTLRPISEMPEAVPEGLTRMFGYQNEDGTLKLGDIQDWSKDTLFIDIRLPAPPDPLAEERAKFEAWYDSTTDYSRPTSSISKESHWTTWKGAKGI